MTFDFFKSWFIKNNEYFFKYSFIFFLIIYIFPDNFFNPMGFHIDPSWQIAIYQAVEKGLSFGNDIVFTYGPLSTITLRLPIIQNPWLIALLDIYIMASLALFFHRFLSQNKGFYHYLILYLGVVILFSERYFVVTLEQGSLLIFLQIFFLSLFYQEQKKFFLIQAIILTSIIYFIKVSNGVIALFIFFSSLGYFALLKKISIKWLLLSLGILSMMMIGIALIYRVDLWNYTIGNLQTISSYNDVMYLDFPPKNPTDRLFDLGYNGLFLYFSFTVVFFYKTLWKDHFLKWIFAIQLLIYFVLLKQSFVRADQPHYVTFFSFVSIFAILHYWNISSEKTIYKYFALTTTCIALVVSLIGLQKTDLFSFDKGIWGWIDHKFLSIKGYTSYLSEEKHTQKKNEEINNLRGHLKISDSILHKIGKQSVDIIPWDIANIYYNQLQYTPRPVMQSYAVQNKYLIDLNTKKYYSSNAPEFVFYRNSSIDDRYPYWDDVGVKTALLQNYSLVLPSHFNFDAQKYLEKYSDVDSLIKKGVARSPLHHFLTFGRKEKRQIDYYQNFNFDANIYGNNYSAEVSAYLQINKDKKAEDHYKNIGYLENKESSALPFLLKKNKTIKPLKWQTIKSDTLTLNQWIEIPKTDDLIYLFADIQHDWYGKIRRLLFQPPHVVIYLRFENGIEHPFRLPLTIAKEGILINKQVLDNLEALALQVYKGKENPNITAFKIVNTQPKGIKSTIKIQLKKLLL
ncbi:hypothetical protein AD998_21250 [bacterium 336/3]|nr:hypothetical protein AD998_21250 [bacterium 336/3]